MLISNKMKTKTCILSKTMKDHTNSLIFYRHGYKVCVKLIIPFLETFYEEKENYGITTFFKVHNC